MQDNLAGRFKKSSDRDGPGVFRVVTDKEALARDPRLAGKLGVPAGVSLRVRTDGVVRILTVNIHMAVPEALSAGPAENEDIAALRDVARFINRMDPDIVLVQEIRNRPVQADGAGLSDMDSVFAHLIGASDKAFTPALAGDGVQRKYSHYGTGIYTRNGFVIERAVNAALPNEGKDTEPRSAGIAAIHSPDGAQKLTVMSTHLSHMPEEHRALRARQLGALADIARSLRETGVFAYTDALEGKPCRGEDFPRQAIVLGGDLNQKQPESDDALKPAGFVHAGDAAKCALDATALDPQGKPHRIDHLYVHGVRAVLDVHVAPVPQAECKTGAPTDHKAVIADIRP